MSNFEDKLKLFGLSNMTLQRDLDKVERKFKIDLERKKKEKKDDSFYPQFESSLRAEAAEMKEHYELFYCLEKSIRTIIEETLKVEHKEKWWEKCVTEAIRTNAKKAMQTEMDAGVTPRSDSLIDFTTFGELGQIVRSNWKNFDPLFSSERAFSKIMTSLNVLRGPIAHCSALADDEVIRLNLSVRDWFRLMG